MKKILLVEDDKQISEMLHLHFKTPAYHLTSSEKPFIFSEILQELVKGFALRAAEKNIQIECINCTDASWINADIRLMERVIQNLVVNAVSYTPKDGKIRIMLNRTNGELVFTIENDGPSLPDDIMLWLNTPEENNAVKKPSKSTIGLSIVKKILYLHQYAFNVKEGNTFSFHMMIYQFTD